MHFSGLVVTCNLKSVYKAMPGEQLLHLGFDSLYFGNEGEKNTSTGVISNHNMQTFGSSYPKARMRRIQKNYRSVSFLGESVECIII